MATASPLRMSVFQHDQITACSAPLTRRSTAHRASGGHAPFVPVAPGTSCIRSLAMRARSSAALPKCSAISAGSRVRMPSRRSSSSLCRLSVSIGLMRPPPVRPGTGGPPLVTDHSPSLGTNFCPRRSLAGKGSSTDPRPAQRLSCPARMGRNESRYRSCEHLECKAPMRVGRQAKARREDCSCRQVAIARFSCRREASAEQRDLLLGQK